MLLNLPRCWKVTGRVPVRIPGGEESVRGAAPRVKRLAGGTDCGRMSSALESARAAFARDAWRDACVAFETAAAEAALEPDDYEHLAVAAYLTGEDDRCVHAWEAAHRTARDAGDHAAAARSAVLLTLCLVLRGQMAQAGGWLGRAEGLLEQAGSDCVAPGYVLIPKLLGVLDEDPSLAAGLAMEAAAIAKRCGDDDLLALAVLGQGQALIGLGELDEGMARLDEVMVSVSSREVGPVVTGIVYCAVIVECLKLYDLARASEWTEALSDWCEGQPDLTDRAAAVAEMRRVTAPGGRVVIGTPGTIQPVFEIMERALVEHISKDLGGFVRAVFSMHDPDALAALLRDAGLRDVTASEEQATLQLPAPADFLWQYINLTPIAPIVANATDEAKAAMERHVVDGWQPYVIDGAGAGVRPIVVARGVK